jgi:hypothetical protein
MAIAQPTTVTSCYWCGFKRSDHYGNAGWADTMLRCPNRLAVRAGRSERRVREPTYQAVARVQS